VWEKSELWFSKDTWNIKNGNKFFKFSFRQFVFRQTKHKILFLFLMLKVSLVIVIESLIISSPFIVFSFSVAC
jgi:hypothetical protein